MDRKILEMTLNFYRKNPPLIQSMYNITVNQAWHINKRVINEFLLVMCKTGSGWYCLDGTKVDMKPGKIFFITPGLPHEGGKITKDFSLFSLRFKLEDPDKNIPGTIMNKKVILSPANPAPFYQLFDEIYNYHTLRGNIFVSENMSGSLIFQFLLKMYEEKGVRERRPLDGLDKTRIFIEENPTMKLTLKQLSQNSRLSPVYFSRQFKARYGITIKKHICDSKLKHALHLLSETNLTIKDISEQLGYSDPYIFSNIFKKKYALSPGRYRKRITESEHID